MNNEKINFQDVFDEAAGQPSESVSVEQQLLQTLNEISEAAGNRLTEVESELSSMEGRMQMLEKYVAFLLTKNPDFKDWLKQQIKENEGKEDVGQGTSQQAT
jgi:hypothetical protein